MPTFYKLRYRVQDIWGISRGILKPSTDFIQFLFKEIKAFLFGFFVSNNDPAFLYLFEIAWIVYQFGTVIFWNLGWIIYFYFLYNRFSQTAWHFDTTESFTTYALMQ